MRRELMILKIQEILVEQGGMTLEEAATDILNRLEKAGMAPPGVSNDYGQALSHVYIYPDFNQWDEDVEKDEKVMAALKSRQEARSKKC